MARRHWLILFGLAVLLALPLAAQDKKKDGVDDLLDNADKGAKYRLASVAAPERSLAEALYWRTHFGTVAAQTTPIRFHVEGTDVIAPVLNPSAAPDGKGTYSYPIEGHAKLKPGKYTLKPGGIAFEVKATEPTSSHPAFKVEKGEVRILCAPVRLDIVDERGVPAPGTIRLFDEKDSLLREEARFSVLTVWLPVGGEYQTSLGSFALTADGKIKAGKLAAGVSATAEGLRKTVPAAPVTKVAAMETVTLSGAKEGVSCRAFVPAMVKPGERLSIMVSRREYELASGRAFAPGNIQVQIEDAVATDGQQGQVAEAVREQAAAVLKTTAEDLGSLTVPLPAATVGPIGLILHAPTLGSARTTVLVTDATKVMLVPHRWRTVFACSENAVYQVLLPRGSAASEAKVLLQTEKPAKERIPLGTMTLPAVAGDGDARLFTLRMADIPLGRHVLQVETPAGRCQVPLTVVSDAHLSPFFTHSISGCTTCWPTSDEGLDVLQKAGLEMVSATGASSLLDTHLPQIDRNLAARLQELGLPAEAAVRPAANDRLLQRLLAHRLRLIDLTVVREGGMYNEGLSYHHSYQPSVDRTVRRMQLFTQQTADYPSFWGVNYSWFPNLFGYVEGGVATDAHVHDRNRVLMENVSKAGFPPLTREEADWVRKSGGDPAQTDKALSLIGTALAHRNAVQDLGWAKHNALYNQAVHEIRPDLACTLFENAGHDEGKRLRSMYHAMNAQCYESYTDYGDWPMSAAFVTDWSHGQSPGQPVWLTTCWGTSSEGKMKSLFHAFARGLEGGGVPMEGNFELSELDRRGMGLRFVSQYGAVARHAVPDRRVAILARSAHQVFGRLLWDCHATYYHLTRVGYPPVIVADDEFKKTGLAAEVKVLVLVKEELPLEPETRQAIEAFQKRGGQVIALGCTVPVAGAIEVKEAPKHLWEGKGFHPDSHAQMWQEFEKKWQTSLGDALAKAGVSAAARTDPPLGLAVSMDAGAVRYVAVMADLHGTHSNHFEPTPDMPLSLEGTGWTVRDLVKQKTLPTKVKDGRTETTLELRTEPVTLLALYRSAPAVVKIELASEPRLGSELIVRSAVSAAERSDLGAVPVAVTLKGPDGVQREKLFRAAGDMVRVPLAAHDQAGKWSLTIQELLTGVTATTEFTLQPAANAVTVAAVGDVHVVNATHLQQFVVRPGERLVIVEPEQAHLLPLAQKLTDDLKAAGVPVRLWQVRPEEYDTQPVRWYPTPADEHRLADIEAGKLIGVRENMLAYIDKVKRAHVPERGGYSEIQPPYMVGRDCIVFSGGRLAESLRAVTPWLETPQVPGHGQGRLVVCFSPFTANRQAVAVVGNDVAGLTRAAGELAAAFKNKAAAEKPKTEETKHWVAAQGRDEVLPVPTPFVGFSPLQRVVRLLANADGQAAVLLNGKADNVALVDGAGQLTATVKLDLLHAAIARLDTLGQLQLPVRKVTATHPGWGFPTEAQVRLLAIGPDGQLKRELLAYTGSLDVPDYQGGLLWSADGSTTALGRAGGLVFQHSSPEWRRYDDVPHASSRFSLLYPRHPVGAVLSADGRYLLFTMDSRTPFGGLLSPTPRPTGCETVLLDLKTGERLWSLTDKDRSKSTYAIHTGFAALSRDASVAAFADHAGSIYLVDRTGKVRLSEKIMEEARDAGAHNGPPDGVGVCLSETGKTAVFAFRRQLVIVSDNHIERLKIEGVTSAAVSADGSLIVAGCGDGKVRAFDPAGKQVWEATPRGAGPLVAAAGTKGFLVATGDGDLVLLDRDGKEVRRTALAAAADKDTHELKPAADMGRPTPPVDYVEPPTLALARKQLGAKEVDAWKPSGAGQRAFGRSFHVLESKAELSAGAGEGEFFVHLVYRRPASNKSLRILTNGKDGAETFWLDLPTPEYRVIDLPLRGPKATVTLQTDGPVEVAELSLWSLRWPGPNMAYVRPAGIESKPSKEPSDDILGELDGNKKSVSGKLKECRIWWPNTDPDSIRGPWLPAPVDPLQMVDGKRFGGGKIGAWASQDKNYQPSRGGFFTVDFGEAQEPTLLATCDRADRQSAVCVNLAAFAHDNADALQGGTILGGVVGNDQFWRLVPLKGAKVKVLGVHVIKDPTSPAGLSEVEVYK